MSAMKELFADLVEVVITIFTGTPVSKQLLYQEVQQDWWNVKGSNSNIYQSPTGIDNGIRRM
jgi:hypothetical protein